MYEKLRGVRSCSDGQKMYRQPKDTTQESKTFLRDAETVEAYCGTKSCQPKCLQCCVNIKVFTFFVSISSLLSFSLTMYLSSQVTAIEKHFNFNSSQSGFLLCSNDIGFLVSVLIFSYTLKNSHIPRVLGVSTVVYGVAGIVSSIPYFFSPVPFISKNQTTDPDSETMPGLCKSGNLLPNETAYCEQNGNQYKSNMGAFAVIAIGMIMQGLAKAPRSPLQASYIDDNVKKTKTGAYMGTIIGISILGPALAFMLGGLFSSIYVTLEDTDLTPKDSYWIGAWWLGFICFGFASLAASIPLFFFPKTMKPRDKSSVVKEGQSFIKMMQAMKRIMTNPLFVSICCFSCLRSFTISGSVAFMPKYFETQFYIPAWKSNLIIGGSYILLASLGSISGGTIAACFKMGPKGSIKFLLVQTVLALILLWICPAITCPQPQFEETHLILRSDSKLMSPQPNSTHLYCRNCECDEFEYEPVCGEDGRNFLSPCMAGCHRKSSTGIGYEHCTCVGGNQTVLPGTCPSDCSGLYIIAAVLAIRAFAECVTIGPHMLIVLRTVSDTDKTFAVGVLSFFSSALGWLPGPPSHGALIDTFCTRWRHLPCGRLGACTAYDVDAFRIGFFSLQGGLHFAAALFVLVMCYYGLYTKRYFHNDKTMKIYNGKEILAS